MNNKHIACFVIMFVCVLIFQGVSAIRQRATAMQTAAETAHSQVLAVAAALNGQRALLDDLKGKTSDLITYLDDWEPHLARLSTPEAGELNVNALVKQSNLLLLAQRFELAANKVDTSVPTTAANLTIPQFVRARLTIEDDFTKSVNWLGDLEARLPTARLANLELTRGQTGNDVRMDLVIDIPLAVPRATPTPSPAP